MESVNFVFLWIILISCGLGVKCKADSCNGTTLDCPKIVREQKKMTKYIPATCYKAVRTCPWWDVFKIRCRYERSLSGCSTQIYYFETTTKEVPGCCPGYYLESDCCIKEECKRGFWGQNCTKRCTCWEDSYEKCDINGTCLCKPGWIGLTCAKQCMPGTYGVDCQWNCSCDNNATCHHVTGECNCTTIAGWTGERCDIECPGGFYGRNCSLPCNCSDFQDPVCHPLSGRCVCNSGKTGENCSLDCKELSFGPNCDDTCDCIKDNSRGCNSSNGHCDCKKGWTGDKCEQRCDPLHYGNDCNKNCSCSATEICDNINGTCSLASICLSEFSLNCLSSFAALTCEQLSENCTDSDAPVPSLTKDMLDICCEKKDLMNISLCIAEGDCNCRSGYGSKACNETVLLQLKKEDADSQKPNDVSPVVVAIVTVILVIAAVVIITVFWRRRRGIHKEQKSKGIHNPGYGNTIFDKVQGEGPKQRQEENQSEMYTLNGSDVNCGYDVSVNDSRNNENENYSSTNAGEPYDHLERNSCHNSNRVQRDDTYSHAQQNSSHISNNRDDTYSNAQQNSSNDSNNRDDTYSHAQPAVVDVYEYDTTGGLRVPSDSVYDHTDTQNQLYSNTTDPKVQGTSVDDEYMLG